MTNEEIFNNNINIAFKLMNNYKDCEIEYEDKKQICLLGLWKAVITFDKEKKIAFSTYAYKVIQNELNYYLRKNKKHTKISINQVIYDDITLENTVEDNVNEIDELLEKIDLEKVKQLLYKEINTFKCKNKQICELVLQGYTQLQVAKKMNISQAAVSRIRKKLIENVKKYEI